ncbi:STAS/SEC14 domain-containing protein [uncultured Erythrobacter sp.]|uniref:STAS/SEC14 domain-containing protein n=1 Tax=uncultured Erythrobacter sp. TaxID=263913 RepID=UPI0026590538|nr:STAS/SEC14 domain-containing protein [uncultured Erythrobacter sp.]
MNSLTTRHKVSRNVETGEVYFAISGFWKLEEMQAFLRELNEAAAPIVAQRTPIRVSGEMEGFVPQDRQTGEVIRDHLMMSRKYGLQRVAIVTAPVLVKLQYRRLSQGIEVEFFDSRNEAIAWLRRP